MLPPPHTPLKQPTICPSMDSLTSRTNTLAAAGSLPKHTGCPVP